MYEGFSYMANDGEDNPDMEADANKIRERFLISSQVVE
jgi:hypothetical protein